MNFEFGEIKVNANLKDVSIIKSLHTGKDLKRINILINGLDELSHDALQETIDEWKNDIKSVDVQGKIKWEIINHSYGYTDRGANTRYSHDILLQEIEEFKLENLVIGGFEIQPYYYTEKIENDILTIQAKVLLSPIQYNELKSLMQGSLYFPVIM